MTTKRKNELFFTAIAVGLLGLLVLGASKSKSDREVTAEPVKKNYGGLLPSGDFEMTGSF